MSDILSYRVVVFGFLMLSIVIISGAIWAQEGVVALLGLGFKETWSLITWIIYAIYLHLRLRKN